MRSCLAMNTDDGYARARELLKSRYGQPFKIATAYIDKVLKTPLIKAEDARALQRYSVLLASCENTLTKIGYASKIDSPDTLRKIIEKLPFSLRDRWRATADDINEVKRRDVTIHDVDDFVTKKARAVNRPIFGSIINDTRSDNSKATKPQHKSTAVFPRASTFATREEPEPHTVPTQHEDESSSAYVAKEGNSGCYLCSKDLDHRLTRCELFKNKSYDERCKFVRWKGLCYNCLNPGHRSDACPKESFCRVTGCKFTRKHSTFLHPQEKPVRTETQIKQESTQLSKPSEEGDRQPSIRTPTTLIKDSVALLGPVGPSQD
ncbi:hypothetical protein QZH41_005679 [Actinostola sp. cb2023]|nr:hypothetical protein QZH41_005679 [Actinostola sp. cb2023]